MFHRVNFNMENHKPNTTSYQYTNACTHELKNWHISAMAYYINTLAGDRSVHGRCEPKCFKDEDLF